MPLSHIIGVDDAPFVRSHRGNVLVVGAVHSGTRLEGVLTTRVRRDGANATRALISRIHGSRFAAHLQLVMLQGIALAGFNVVDIHTLSRALALPVLVIARRAPRMESHEKANTFTLTLDWRMVPDTNDRIWKEKIGVKLTPDQATILNLAQDAQGVSPEEAASATELDLSEAKAIPRSGCRRDPVS